MGAHTNLGVYSMAVAYSSMRQFQLMKNNFFSENNKAKKKETISL